MNINVATICIGGAIILAAGIALGMFIIGMFALRNYDRGYRDGREEERHVG